MESAYPMPGFKAVIIDTMLDKLCSDCDSVHYQEDFKCPTCPYRREISRGVYMFNRTFVISAEDEIVFCQTVEDCFYGVLHNGKIVAKIYFYATGRVSVVYSGHLPNDYLFQYANFILKGGQMLKPDPPVRVVEKVIDCLKDNLQPFDFDKELVGAVTFRTSDGDFLHVTRKGNGSQFVELCGAKLNKVNYCDGLTHYDGVI